MSQLVVVSVVVPTYHRPRSLSAAVASALARELAEGDLELVVSLSDPAAAPDREPSEALRAAGRRVKLAAAERPGPAAARNAGLRLDYRRVPL